MRMKITWPYNWRILFIDDEEDQKSEVTDVVGIQYGADCAITFSFQDKEEDEAFREEALENLNQMANTFQHSLDAHHDVF